MGKNYTIEKLVEVLQKGKPEHILILNAVEQGNWIDDVAHRNHLLMTAGDMVGAKSYVIGLEEVSGFQWNLDNGLYVPFYFEDKKSLGIISHYFLFAGVVNPKAIKLMSDVCGRENIYLSLREEDVDSEAAKITRITGINKIAR
jgi:hypothetical protein